jgi:hypothetical protein
MIAEDGGIVSAAAFVPGIEQLGFIRLIDRFVLERAVSEVSQHPDCSLAFNISGLTATDHTWLRLLVSLLRDRPDVARQLIIEITETAALHDIAESARFVGTLRELGCRVALDDFGAGFTSFRYMQALDVDIVKIDGSFVRNLAESYDNQIFLRHLVGLAWPTPSAWSPSQNAWNPPATRRSCARRECASCKATTTAAPPSSSPGVQGRSRSRRRFRSCRARRRTSSPPPSLHRHARACPAHPRVVRRPRKRGWPKQVRP